MKAPKPKSNYEPVPAGNHVARLYQIIYLGTVPTTFQGEEKMTNKVRLSFELCNETKVFKEGEEARPFSISREFTFSMGAKSNLRPFVEGFGGIKLHDEEAYNFDLDQLLGDACLLNVTHSEKDGNTYSNIQGASPMLKGMEAPALFNEKSVIDVNSTSEEEIAALPEFIKGKIYSSEEWTLRMDSKRLGLSDDAPKEASASANRPDAVAKHTPNREEGEVSAEELADIE